MNAFSKLKKIITKTSLVGLVVAGTMSLAVSTAAPVSAAAVGGDCDTNAVIWCGIGSVNELQADYVSGVSGHNSATSIHDIYANFGITATAIKAMDATAVAGRVTNTGQVFVGSSQLVATGATSAGRQPIAGSTTVTQGTTTFYTRPTSVSFKSPSLTALVVMKNGVFQFAILNACGNPVKANAVPAPKPKVVTTPAYNINKTVAVKGSNVYSKDVAVKTGTHVVYHVTVNSTGTAPVTGLVVKDVLPANVTYVAGSLNRDTTALGTASAAQFFGTGFTVSSLANGSSTTFQFEAIVGATDTAVKCVVQTLTNTGAMTATSLPGQTSTATVNKQCVPVTIVTNTVVPPTVVTPPTALVNTGPGSILGIFGVTTTVAAVAYNWMVRRRLSIDG